MTTLAYLATPYSRAPGGIGPAFEAACIAAARLIERGHAIFAPIPHAHPIAIHGGIDPLDHSRWLKLDAAMMARCDELWIVQMPGWDSSVGIRIERETFERAGKPVRMVSWPGLEIGEPVGRGVV